MAKYKLDFYRDKNGYSETLIFIDALKAAAKTDKNARVQYNLISRYINLLLEHGSILPDNFMKHIYEDIWELRPGYNRILYFCWQGDTFVLLNHFRKTTAKTPVNEIIKAKRERDDYRRRHK